MGQGGRPGCGRFGRGLHSTKAPGHIEPQRGRNHADANFLREKVGSASTVCDPGVDAAAAADAKNLYQGSALRFSKEDDNDKAGDR